MATYIKGSIQYTPVVEQINHKFAVNSKKCVASKEVGGVVTQPNYYMGGGTRESLRIKLGAVRKNYFFFRENARKTEASARELEIRQAFLMGNRWAVAAFSDLSAIQHNTEVFNALRQDPTAYIPNVDTAGKTFYGLFRAYAIQTLLHGGTLPENHQLPNPSHS